MIHVVLCTHNGVDFVEEQIKSIADQKLAVGALHIFDFGSTDGTRELLWELADRWSIIDLHEFDIVPGPAASFFIALRRIAPVVQSEDLVFLCDQDDVWLPEKTAVVVDRLREEPAASSKPKLLFHDVTICDAELDPIRTSFYDGRPFRMPRDLDRTLLFAANPVIGHTVAINKELLTLALGTLSADEYIMHDWALTLLAAFKGDVIFIDRQLGLYRQHANNILGTRRNISLLRYLRKSRGFAMQLTRQAAAFRSDIERECSSGSSRFSARLRAYRSNLLVAWALLSRGPSLGHRLFAIFPLLSFSHLRRSSS